MASCIVSQAQLLPQSQPQPQQQQQPRPVVKMKMKEKEKKKRKRPRKLEMTKKKKRPDESMKPIADVSRPQWQLRPHRQPRRPEKEDSEEMQTKEKEKRKRMRKVEMNKKKKRADEPMKPIVKVELGWVQPNINVGDPFDIPHLLSYSCPPRDYLITSNQKQVKIMDQLYGKYVLLIFFGLSDVIHTPQYTHTRFIADLQDMYNTRKHEFEVVFIAFGDNKDAFDKSVSTMPWFAIPHKDHEARDLLQVKFGLPGEPCILNAVLFNPQGIVLQTDALSLIQSVGPQGFPFTQQKIDQICCLHPLALWDQLVLEKQTLSLTLLLGGRLISPEGNEVPTSELEVNEKIVGLYFFELGSGVIRTKKLLETWKALKENGGNKDFEVVFIYANRDASRYFSEGDFVKKFGCTNPWYKLPSSDGRELSRLLRVGVNLDGTDAGYLIILKADKYEPLSYFALSILQVFGPPAYPFTLETAVDIANREEHKMTLANLFISSTTLSVGAPGQACTTTISELLGKRVLLLFATYACYKSGPFMRALMRMYDEQKGTDDCFNIIYISLDCDKSESYFNTSIQEMPWFVLPFNPSLALWSVHSLFGNRFPTHQLPAIVAFGRDGYLETKESNLTFKECTSSYPFIQADMTEEVRRELISTYKWNLEYFHFPEETTTVE